MSKPNHKYQFFPFVGQMEDTQLPSNKNDMNDIQYSNAILYPANPYSTSKLRRKRRLEKIIDNGISIKRLQRLKDSLSSDLMNVDKENVDNKVASAAEPQSINSGSNEGLDNKENKENQINTLQSLKKVVFIIIIHKFIIFFYRIFINNYYHNYLIIYNFIYIYISFLFMI